MGNEFEDLIYLVIDFDSIPSGWSNQEKRDSRKHVNSSIGEQSNIVSQLKTGHRKDIVTVLDEELPETIVQTAGKALFRIYTDLSNTKLKNAIYAAIADKLNKTVNAVKQKVEIIILGNQEAMLAYLAANKEKWGEATP